MSFDKHIEVRLAPDAPALIWDAQAAGGHLHLRLIAIREPDGSIALHVMSRTRQPDEPWEPQTSLPE